jgi:intermediate filament protein if
MQVSLDLLCSANGHTSTCWRVRLLQNNQLMREIEALKREKEERERELEQENASLRADANQLKLELDAIMRELQLVLNTKLSLELEIAAYRKLLESEENR